MRVRIVLYLIPVLFFLVCCRSSSNKYFESLSPSSTNITFENKLEKKPLFNILYYLYYYNGGGVATGDVNNDGLTDIYFTANSKGHNKLYLNKGGFKFEDITDRAAVNGLSDWCSGVTMADVNGDGLLDIYVSTVSQKYGLKGHNELYINNGNLTFSEKSAQYGLNTTCFTTQSAFFDYDHDGDLDCYILNQSHHPHANIYDTSYRRRYDSLSGDRLYRNDLSTTGKFTDVSQQAGIYQSNLGYGLGLAIADMNNDGWDDIYVGNDFHENDYYYINKGDGTFMESGAEHFKHYSRFSMGNDIADFNNDGQPDIVTVDMLPPDEKTLKTYGSDENLDIYKLKIDKNGYQQQYSRNCLQLNNGNGKTFSDVALSAGVSATDWSWSPLFADFNNDGRKDLFVASGIVKRPVDMDYVHFVSGMKMKGMDNTDIFDDDAINAMPDGACHPFLFENNGGVKFTDESDAYGLAGLKGYFNGAAYADLDNDGKLDMVVNCLNAPARIFKNNSPGKNFLSIKFKGDSMNTTGIGAKAWIFNKTGIQYQELMLTRGFQSSSDTKLHFGLDTATVDSILIVWPNQKMQVLKNIGINKLITADQKAALSNFDYAEFFRPKTEIFTNITQDVNVRWTHVENDFNDFERQYLLPHMESTFGPKIAVADINNDGLDDYYVCGAKGQPGALMVQKAGSGFERQDTALFNRFAVCEDVAATFFDANGDGFADLWVVSGGNEVPSNDISNTDRLYINDGKGHFKVNLAGIPQIYDTKSCIAVADIDKDGDQDVFIGHLCDQFKFGPPVSSYLYINDGTGKFSIASNKQMNLLNTGLVTSAVFSDLNNDGWPDLVVAGEWMPVKIFLNNKGVFTDTGIDKSTGLWQSLYATDVNGDGFMDILAGNWGHNSKLWSGKNGPVKLYIKDFDGNASIEQVMCYTVNGEEFTFLAKDELERSLPILKKAYLTYSEVAGKTVQYMFYDLFKDYTELKAETLSSACFLNNGKGNFKQVDLPEELQLSPIFAFTDARNGSYLAGGNFYGTIPYEGRYDALLPTLFSYDKKVGKFNVTGKIDYNQGEVRDFKWMKSANNQQLLTVAVNNGPVQFYKLNNQNNNHNK